ncbi:hypothetical protein TruAng_002524 [Truncatella angustata]|nr:hypothetical protein TruAng_002524 [Truncatella angustata]
MEEFSRTPYFGAYGKAYRSQIAANTSNISPAVEVLPQSSTFAAETAQLTDNVLANLTALQLSNISLFGFSTNNSNHKRSSGPVCKTYPGDSFWPISLIWDIFDLLLGGALIKAVPIASPCYKNFGNYDADRCAYVGDQWSVSNLHEEDPTSIMSPLYQGLTCLPDGWGPYGNCTMGGYPSYVVNITSVAQIQLAVNFARNLNIRLVVKNTGHDFKGRSAGAGALSIWTHYLKDLEFIESFTLGSYSGPVIKAGSGIQGTELYEFADANNVTALAGEGRTVGWGGGYIAGGGHSPLSSKYGMAADQIVSIDLVTPDGRFIAANEIQNSDLFWGLCGGGGSTFGVVTSYTIKVHPRLDPIVISTFSISTSGNNVTTDVFWGATKTYFSMIPTFVDAGTYAYWYFFNASNVLSLTVFGWVAPGYTTESFNNLTTPLFNSWSGLGIDVEPDTTQHSSFLDAFNQGFPQESVGTNVSRAASRLVSRDNLVEPAKLNTTFDAFKSIVKRGGGMVGVATTGGPANMTIPDNAVNDAWRTASAQILSVVFWDSGATLQEAAEALIEFNTTWLEPVRAATPGGGAYNSEGNIIEPDWQNTYYGAEKYAKLSDLKERYDPTGLFYTIHGVGSENWYITDQLVGLPTQNGRLCRVAQ